MELDELIREARPQVGPPPALTELRGVAARRARRRRVGLATSALALVAVAVIAAFLAQPSDHDGTVAVRPPDRAAGEVWTSIGNIPLPGVTGGQIIVAGSRVVFAGESSAVAGGDVVVVRALDSTTHAVTDLGPPARTVRYLMYAVGWHDGVVLMTHDAATGHSVLDRWSGGVWEQLPLPAMPPGYDGAGLYVLSGRLVLQAVRSVADDGAENAELVWATEDGRTWKPLPSSTVKVTSPSSYVIGSDRMLQVGPPWHVPFSYAAWRVGDSEWQPVDRGSVPLIWPVSGGWLSDMVFACGSGIQDPHVDCLSWADGDATFQSLAPLPLQTTDLNTAKLLQSFVTGSQLVVGGMTDPGSTQSKWYAYAPARKSWSSVEAPSVPGAPRATTVSDGGTYVAFFDASGVDIQRLRVG